MNWQKALDEIQSVAFDADLNVVSGTNAFFRTVSQDPVVLEAYREMLSSGEVREDALGRIYDLVGQETDPRFENPNDTPLAVLLWLTNFAAPDFVHLAAARVDCASRCWYAKKLAQRILNPPPSSTRGSKFGDIPARHVATDVTSGEMGLIWDSDMETPLHLAVSDYYAASSIPATPWEFSSTFETAVQEDTH